jgi:hypothetical protein
MSYNYFLLKLAESKQYEIKASELISAHFNVDILNFNDDNKYDFKASDGLLYEVKADKMSLKTGNFFIEYEGYGRPSGISVSIANYYILSNTEQYYLISSVILKELCEIHGVPSKVRINDTFGFLIKCAIVITNSIQLQ